MKTPLIVTLTLLLTACASSETKPEAKPASTVEAAQPQQIEESRAVAKTLATQLGGKLKESMSKNGPAQSISVCKEIAPQIAADLSKQTGWQVGRVGTRARNAATGVPNAWQAEALASFAERMKNGEKADTLEFAQVVTDSTGKHLHYAKAIAIQPVCLTCHGPADKIADGVKARLNADYPLDRATGYQEGELRGAVVITRPL
ncbi:DUF3365 domain-containing protein [Thiobacillus sp.]|uniref:Tll0287-like domain-containing protein n=1 Tax=Thiobacillus sp. TaxID=924 RepID=UPI0025D938CF|nr:DUF3365 domain-containing protein [Thiobacillus sp.]MBT9539414.1 DUF3365 domain-containing protein [Thiobacillus sp.]